MTTKAPTGHKAAPKRKVAAKKTPKPQVKKKRIAVTKKRSDKLETFCKWYVGLLGNATAAYRKAYPKQKEATLWAEASRSLRLPKVRERIRELMTQQHAGIMMGKDDVLREVSLIAQGDLANCFDENARLLHPTMMDLPTRLNVHKIETTTLRKEVAVAGKNGEAEYYDVEVTKLEFGKDKLAALDKLMRHYNAFEDIDSKNSNRPIKIYLMYPEDAKA